MERVLFIGAHNDDPVIGAGGAILKYKQEGKDVSCVIFSYGEGSHPHLKKEVIKEIRLKEAQESNTFIGLNCLGYFDLNETRFKQQIQDRDIKKRLSTLIKDFNPSKILTHSADDPHPDHRQVFKLVKQVLEEDHNETDMYSFDIWNIVNFRHRNEPKLVVDISDHFPKKIEAIKKHKSQVAAITSLLWKVYLKDWLNGFSNNCRYAEVFVKIR